jgi:Fe-S cluster assembly iron-binding protein IscA
MDIAKEAQKDDMMLEVKGLKIFLEKRAKGMLMNTSIDFQEGHGFTLTGMQPTSCSC